MTILCRGATSAYYFRPPVLTVVAQIPWLALNLPLQDDRVGLEEIKESSRLKSIPVVINGAIGCMRVVTSLSSWTLQDFWMPRTVSTISDSIDKLPHETRQ
jgi:hypothetical protein